MNMKQSLRTGATPSEQDAYNQLRCYTLAHGDPASVHQHVVDAFAAQTTDDHNKPITLGFALIGLFLHVERQFSGRKVQQAHMRWPVDAFCGTGTTGAATWHL